MPRRRAKATISTVHVCLRERPLSFEHVPPSAAFNIDKVEIGGLKHWLERDDDGIRVRHVIHQGGAGLSRLCEDCNNRTGSWYAAELTGWVYAAVAAIRSLPSVAEMDARLEDHSVMFRIEGVRPLAMVKQIVTMVLVVNDLGFAIRHPDLRAFVPDRHRSGLYDVQVYLALYLGPIVRFVGTSGRANLETGTRVRPKRSCISAVFVHRELRRAATAAESGGTSSPSLKSRTRLMRPPKSSSWLASDTLLFPRISAPLQRLNGTVRTTWQTRNNDGHQLDSAPALCAVALSAAQSK
jgi:hypothetical protein